MQQEDKLSDFFKNEQSEKLQLYGKRLSSEEFKALGRNRLKSEYQFLSSSKAVRPKDNTLSQSHAIKQIRGTRMRSVVDNQIYSIFCQAPQDFENFWSSCYKQRVSKIFMILPQYDIYWPELNQKREFPKANISISCQKEEIISKHLQRRQILISGLDGDILVEHIHFKSWNDGSVPQGEESEAVYRSLVEEAARAIENKELILIHCLAGIGRTGTFAATIQAVRSARKYNSLSLFEIVANMRNYRRSCVETFDQYSFVHKQSQMMI